MTPLVSVGRTSAALLMQVVLLLTTSASSSSGFAFHAAGTNRGRSQPLFSTVDDTSAPSDVSSTDFARQDLIATAERLKQEFGVFLIDSTAKKDLDQVVKELETSPNRPTPGANVMEQYVGDWTLVCTTASSNEGLDTSKLPFLFSEGPLAEIRKSIQTAANRYIKVTQRVRSTGNDGVIDRVDHVIETSPPEELRDVLDNLPDALSTLKINPLHVSKSALTLVHKASVEEGSKLKTKITLESAVLNVAGTSQILDPKGKDVAGVNFPAPVMELFQQGDFENTYIDDDVRISRGKQGPFEQLRVFVRTDRFNRDEALQDIRDKGTSVGMGVDADLDVDDVADPDFVVEEEEETGGDDEEIVGGSDTEDLTPSA